MIQITIDTCLINTKHKLEEVNRLEALNKLGLIKIVGTDRLLQETEYNIRRLKKAESYENIGEPFTIGFSRIGKAYISDGKKRPSFNEIASILFPKININDLNRNQSNDVMHLIAHIHSESDYFITDNSRDFINAKRDNKNRDGGYRNQKRIQLEEIGIKVFSPKEIIEVLEKEHGIK
jgi:hypothetical protein